MLINITKKTPHKKSPNTVIIAWCVFVCFILPIVFFSFFHLVNLIQLAIFYVVVCLVFVVLLRKNLSRRYYFHLEAQGIQEKINLLDNQIDKENHNSISFREKIKRYAGLRHILEELNENLSMAYVADKLVSVSFSTISNDKGSGLLYLAVIDDQLRLNLYKSVKEPGGAVIKAKEGDIFDMWVLRHSSALYIEDVRSDFRFDLAKINPHEARPVLSIISVPVISGNKLLGVLRLDNPQPGYFTQEDLRFLSAIADIGAVALENGQLFENTQELAIRDGLTGLYKKEYFIERLAGECKRSIRQKMPISLLMIDIDLFKNYNDTFGHTAGDIMLKAISDKMKLFFNEYNPIIGRFGGEEFCVALLNTNKDGAFSIAEFLRQEIEKMRIDLRRQQIKVTISIGVASFGADATDEKELFIKADRALYDAKEAGRNRVCKAG